MTGDRANVFIIRIVKHQILRLLINRAMCTGKSAMPTTAWPFIAGGLEGRVLETEPGQGSWLGHSPYSAFDHKQEAIEFSLPQMETRFGEHLHLPRMFVPQALQMVPDPRPRCSSSLSGFCSPRHDKGRPLVLLNV